MKSYLNSRKAFIETLTTGLYYRAIKLNLPTRFVAGAMIAALLMPMFFFNNWQKTSAQVPASSLKINVPAPVSAPPQAFNLSSADTVSSKTLASVSSFNASMLSAYGSFVNAVTAPVLPEGFKMAQPVSPLYSFISSSASSASATLGAFLGFSTTTSETTANLLTTETAFNNTAYNFAGDGKSDFARWTPSNGEWSIKPSGGGTNITFPLGNSASVLAPGDFDGDLITDPAVFNAGTWTIKPSGTGTQYTISWGTSGDIPVTGDYNGDGRSDYAIFRPSSSTFWVMHSNDHSYYSVALGAAGDIPVPGDYDGDGITDIAVYRPSEGVWYIKQSSNGITINPPWGVASDIPVPADYDGDGKTDLAVYRPSSGTWYIYKSTGGGYIQQTWGNYGDQPVPADYDGDGKADISVWRPKTGVWFTYKSCNYNGTGCGTDPQYIYETLGMNGDVPVAAAYIKKIGGLVQDYDLAKLRLSPKNATGGTDLYSRNFSWGTGLVGLPGRAGLGAGFGISYNSLVWLKDTTNNVMIFDPDQSNVSPGFKMGFPTIEPVYYDTDTERFSYLMVTPSGGRVEFQQTAASDTYDTVDSSYVQLKTRGAGNPNEPVEDIAITVTGTDGTRMTYEWLAGAFRCGQIKDRNGNFITIVHDEYGLLRTVTDTLGRVITVNYDTEFYPTSITQQWQTNNGQSSTTTTHTWASFAYTTKTITTNFHSSLGVFGPGNGTVIKVLQKVTYSDNSYTTFDYNNYGQVWRIYNFAADWNVLNYVKTNLETPAANQTDCPRFSETRTWVKNFNLNQNNQEQEVVVTNETATGHQIPDLDGNTVTASRIQVAMQNHPHGNITNIYVGESGWMESLPILVNDFANGSGLELKRSNWTKWTQDDENLSFIKNPRVVATKVSDNVSSKKTEIGYKVLPDTTIAEYGLVEEVRLYDGSNTLLKKSNTTYNLNTAYVSRRIIGLPSQSILYDGNSNPMSKVTYDYDEFNFDGSGGLQQNISPIQHDNINFGASFIIGRGNITSMTRHNVSNASTVTSNLKYNTAGAVVGRITPWNGSLTRLTKIDYTDNFNDGGNSRGTFAYPKTITDPAGFSSTIKYRFDTGANVEAHSPTPHGSGNNIGKHTKRLYDSLGRLERETVVNTGAYTRYQYFSNGIQSKTFATITAGAGEAESESWTDGAGRVLRSRSELPVAGSTSRWSGSLVEYDKLGRAIRSTVPTEIDSNWTPAGDDDRGLDSNNNPVWLWNSQEYDWQNRVTKTINTDGTFQTISYNGCGCSGNMVMTVQGEEIFETDWSGNNPASLGKRTQKIYQDVQGRNWKTEILNWDNSVYSTTTTAFNGRDQATSVTKTQEATTNPNVSALSQVWTMSYDGFGRLSSQHRPEQIDTSNAPTYTTYNYNPDDSIESVVDARGAETSYVYNSRGLVDTISYAVPTASTIPVPTTVTFEYDDAGNRKKMTDGLGTIDYTYTELSQLKTEKRTFSTTVNGTLDHAPGGNNDFLLTYDYTLSGQLQFITDPYGQQFNYSYDKVGRLQTVAGSTSFNGITTYANNPVYDARGTLKALQYGNGVQMQITGINNKLQATGFEVKKNNDLYIQKEYKFYEDGSLKFVDDGLSETFDRSYKYDHLGRTVEAKAGIAARGGSSTHQLKIDQPYTMEFKHDAFGHLTSKTGYYYNSEDNTSYAYNANNRNPSWGYDVEGNITYDNDATYQTDAAGRVVKTTVRDLDESSEFYPPIKDYFSGDGRLEKKVRNAGSTDPAETKNYYIYSSVLNKMISETDKTGKKLKTFVLANGTNLAVQTLITINDTTTEYLAFNHIDVSGTGVQRTNAVGSLIGDVTFNRTGEYSPLGRNIGNAGPYISLNTYQGPDVGGMILFDTGQGYRPGQHEFVLDGQPISAEEFMMRVNGGSVAIELRNGLGQTIQAPVYGILGSVIIPTQITIDRSSEGGPYVDLTDYSWINFFNSPQQQETYPDARKLNFIEVRILRDTVEKNLSSDCKEFIKNLVEKVAERGGTIVSTNVLDIFDKILLADGEGNYPNGIWGYLQRSSVSSATGNWENNNASLWLGVSMFMYSDRVITNKSISTFVTRYNDETFAKLRIEEQNKRRYVSLMTFITSQDGAAITIHELIHLSINSHGGKYPSASDTELANAALSFTGQYLDTSGLTPQQATYAGSRIWHNRLAKACGFPVYSEKAYLKYINNR